MPALELERFQLLQDHLLLILEASQLLFEEFATVGNTRLAHAFPFFIDFSHSAASSLILAPSGLDRKIVKFTQSW